MAEASLICDIVLRCFESPRYSLSGRLRGGSGAGLGSSSETPLTEGALEGDCEGWSDAYERAEMALAPSKFLLSRCVLSLASPTRASYGCEDADVPVVLKGFESRKLFCCMGISGSGGGGLGDLERTPSCCE